MSRPVATELKTQFVISSHLQHTSCHAPFTQATLWVCGNHLLSATTPSSTSAPTQVSLWGHQRDKRRLSIDWHWTSVCIRTSTSPRCTVRCSNGWQGCHSTSACPQWQGGGRLLSGCFCCLQETEASLLHPSAAQVAFGFTLLTSLWFSPLIYEHAAKESGSNMCPDISILRFRYWCR